MTGVITVAPTLLYIRLLLCTPSSYHGLCFYFLPTLSALLSCFCKTNSCDSRLHWRSRRSVTHLDYFSQRPAIASPQLRPVVSQYCMIILNRLFVTSFCENRSASRREKYTFGATPTCSSHPAVFSFTSPTYPPHTISCNHFNVSPIIFITPACWSLIPELHGIPLQKEPATFLHRPLAALFSLLSASNRSLHLITRRLANIYSLNDAHNLFLTNFNLDFYSRNLSWSSHRSYFVLAAYAHPPHFTPCLHPHFKVSHPHQIRSWSFSP